MFKRKCDRCGENVEKKHRYCSTCGNDLSKNSQEDWGMLGKNDFKEEQDPFSNSFFGGLSGNMLNKMLGSAMKMLEKEMQKGIQEANNTPKTNIRLMINGKEIDLNKQQRSSIKPQQSEQIPKNIQKNLPLNSLKKLSKLPKVEPKTTIRRFGDKVVYEVEIPGVKSIKDISIIRLENSIEIKAIAKDKAYLKLLPVSLPILNYNLEKDKLILELEAKN